MSFFILSYAFWPYSLTDNLEVARFIIWIISGVCLAVLASYDARWFLLPDKVNYVLIGLGVISSGLALLGSSDILGTVESIIGSVVILSGVYLVLYLISQGRWIGFGDIKLGLGLALLLVDWQLAFVALFAANVIGTLIVIPPIITGKLKRNQHVPFGPLLIAGVIVAQLAGSYLISAYISMII
jgi:prepilin signal peptidase PulO-like enzyme (type II secretory pathway)